MIGGGPGGYVAALRASQLGMKVAVVEREHLGGVCLNWGCIPTKALLRSAEVLDLMRDATAFGLRVEGVSFDLDAIVARSRAVAARLQSGVRGLLRKGSVAVVEGRGRLAGPRTVEVTGRDGARIRSLMNEIQMLLHEHPVNQRRERARLLPVNGWWLWGFGDASADASAGNVDHWSLRSDDHWLRAVWSALETDAGDLTTFGSDTPSGDTLIALSQPPAERTEDSLTAVDAGLLSLLASNVRAGTIRSVDLFAGSTTLRVDSSARLQFWRRPVALSRWLE